MPFADAPPLRRTEVRVEPSLAVELSWLLYSCAANPATLDLGEDLQRRTAGFWDDGCEMQAEILVLAQQLGCLTGWEAAPLFDLGEQRLPTAAPPSLATETGDVRAGVVERLGRLRADRRLRARLGELLRDVWLAASPAWEATGRTSVQRAVARMRASLAHGTAALDLVPSSHIALRHDFAALTRRAAAEGGLLLTPSHFAGPHGHVLDLPGAFSVAVPTGGSDGMAQRRAEAERAAAGLKLLADPTRLLLLREIEDGATGVSELARRVGVSQPTASVHLRQLREAGLVEVARSGAGTRYAVLHAEARRVLSAAAAVVPGASPGAGGERTVNGAAHNGA